MEATSLSTTSVHFDTMASSEPHTFLKLEDLDTNSPQTTFHTDAAQDSHPGTVFVHSKQAKKRKSWGQELPQPKTTLPPRKRAKTEDEKEQRRIERIKRNRAAAHNSRERKRQETETLAVQLARVNAEIDAYRRLYGPLPASVVLPEVTLVMDSPTPAPSLDESRYSIDATPTPATTADDFFDDSVTIKQEPTETYSTTFPPSFEGMDPKATALPLFDLTQHSAAMLCDLQCRSISKRASTQWWAAFLLYLMTLQLQTTYRSLAMTFWTSLPSRTATRLTQASTRRSTSRSTTSSTTPLRSLSTVALAQRNAATATARVRRSASALVRRRFWMQACLRAKAREVAMRRVTQAQAVSDARALVEAGTNVDSEMSNGESGVGR